MPRQKSNAFDVTTIFDEPAPVTPVPIADRVMTMPVRPYLSPRYLASFIDGARELPVDGSDMPGYRFACPVCAGEARLAYGHTSDGPFHITCAGLCGDSALRRHLEALAPLAFEMRNDILFPMPQDMRVCLIAAAVEGTNLGPYRHDVGQLARLGRADSEVTCFDYTGPNGETVMLIARVDLGVKQKQFLPVHHWLDASDLPHVECKFPSGLLPLYNWHELVGRPQDPVLVVEGEKTAEAAKRLFGDRYVVTTSACGALNAAMSDWSVRQGRDDLSR